MLQKLKMLVTTKKCRKNPKILCIDQWSVSFVGLNNLTVFRGISKIPLIKRRNPIPRNTCGQETKMSHCIHGLHEI